MADESQKEENIETRLATMEDIVGDGGEWKRRGNIANLTNSGKGRPKGSLNKSTHIRQEILDGIFGAHGSEDEIETITILRRKLLDGSLAPPVAMFLMQHWLGVPKQKFEVTGQVNVTKVVREIVEPPSEDHGTRDTPTVIDVTPTAELHG